MPHFTERMTFRQMFAQPCFQGWEYMLDYRRNGMDPWVEDATMARFGQETGWPVARMLESLEFVYACCQQRQVFYPLYPESEGKALTGIAAFPLEKEAPFVMIVPGGGYKAVCSLIDGYSYAKQLNAMGYAAFVLSYRVEPSRQPAPQEDLAAAIRFVLDRAEQFRLDPRGYAVMGFSAGGHLTGSFGVADLGYAAYDLPKPGCMILCYPVVTTERQGGHMSSVEAFLGEAQLENTELRNRWSLEKRITPDYPPTFLWQCETDPGVPTVNSRLLRHALEENGVAHVYELPPYVGHGLPENAAPEHEAWLSRAVAFWQQR